MNTLLLRLAAPIQSWGSDSKFDKRMTSREPTKSGVIGMLAAALGRERDEPLNDLVELRFGVRIDQPGQFLKDFQTARPTGSKNAFVSMRHYLMDAVFLVGLEGSWHFLLTLEAAVLTPVFPLYLGRRSCPPVGRISLGIRDKGLEDALRQEPWQASNWYRERELKRAMSPQLALVMDNPETGAYRRRDIPLSFSQDHRQYTYRYISDEANAVSVRDIYITAATEHDPFKEGVQSVSVKD